jgi:phosphoribosyl 1,2-cyclic phosphodiesterase
MRGPFNRASPSFPTNFRDSGSQLVTNGDMGLRFQIIGTSSSGNCALVESAETRILIDAGFSGRRLEGMLKEIGKPIETIDAVFLTHEHSDHASGLRGLAKHRHLRFYANYATANVLQAKLSRDLSWKIFETGTCFSHKDLQIETLLLPHDAMEPVGFIIRTGGDDLFSPPGSMAWMTDLGHTPVRLAEKVRDVQLLVLEANYDVEMLESDTTRPWAVKQRVAGRHGHLSNRDALNFLKSVEQPKWRKVFLGHLSKDCNCPNRVMEVMGNGSCPWPVECLDPQQLIFPEIDLANL